MSPNLLIWFAASALSGQVSANLVGAHGAPVAAVEVVVDGLPDITLTDPNGRLQLDGLAPGVHHLRLLHFDYAPLELELTVGEGDLDLGQIRLATLDGVMEITVTPGTFSMAGGGSEFGLTGEQIRTMSWMEDATRSVVRMPGVASNDYSSKFTIRGGEQDEVLIDLDGMELYEPFHQRDYSGGLFSVVDPETLAGVTLNTGGFSAADGNYMSGALHMRTVDPDSARNAVGISPLMARGLTSGAFADGRGAWLVSARRGMLDLTLPVLGQDEVLPTFYDGQAKVSLWLGGSHQITVQALGSLDQTDVDSSPEIPRSDVSRLVYSSAYTWVTLRSLFSSKLSARTLLYGTQVNQQREGHYEKYDFTDKGEFDVRDDRVYRSVGLKQDWLSEPADFFAIGTGFDVRPQNADYTYRTHLVDQRVDHETGTPFVFTDDRKASPHADGVLAAAYLSPRLSVAERLYLEPGVRVDAATWTGDSNVDPRAAAALALADKTFLRLAWGRYHQYPSIDSLDLNHGVDTFARAERATHYVAGVEHSLRGGLQLRVEGYFKRYDRIAPTWVNLRDQLEVWPEARNDNVLLKRPAARAMGLELFAKYDTGGKVTFWTSYALAKAEDQVTGVVFAEPIGNPKGWQPRLNDQRHTVNADVNYRPTEHWSFNGSFVFYVGWPRTTYTYDVVELPAGDLHFYPVHGRYNAVEYPAYHRLDLRVNRSFDLRLGELTLYVHAINVYNRKNLKKYDIDAERDNGSPALGPDGEYQKVVDSVYWLGIVPVVGLDWTFP